MDKISVFILSDDNYAASLASLMVSISENTKSDVEFYVIDNGLRSPNRQLLLTLRDQLGLRMELMRAVDYRHHVKLPTATSGTIGRAASDKFLVPYMKPDLERAIILDADMIALGDIRELWETNLENKVLAAVPSYGCTNIKQIYDGVRLAELNPLHRFFNTGTLLVDLKKWREEQIGQRISHYTIKFDPMQIRRWDEMVLNILFQINNYKILEPKFNMTIAHLLYYRYNKPSEHKRVIEEHLKLSKKYRPAGINLMHFMSGGVRLMQSMPGNVKPWNAWLFYYQPGNVFSGIPFFKDFWYYLKQTPFYDTEVISFLAGRSAAMEDHVNKDVRDRIRNLIKYNELKREHERNEFLVRLTMGLIPRFTEEAKKSHDELAKIAKSLGL